MQLAATSDRLMGVSKQAKAYRIDKQPHKRLRTERGDVIKSKCGQAGGSEEKRAKSRKVVTASTSNFDSYNDIRKELLMTKGKPPPKTKQMKLNEVNDSDESLSSLSNGSQGHSDKSNNSDDQDGDEDEDNNEFDVVQMTEREIRQLYNDQLPQAADHDAASLFDNDNNVKITTTKSDRSRRGSSSETLRPPTLESKGMFDVVEV